MLIAIILVYNLMLGFFMQKVINGFKRNSQDSEKQLWIILLKRTLVVLSIACYVMQIILAVDGEYKLALSVDIIAAFSLYTLVHLKTTK